MSGLDLSSAITDPAIRRITNHLLGAEFPQYMQFPEWGTATTDQFVEAMRWCLAAEPYKVAAVWGQVTQHLAGQRDPLRTLMHETIASIKTVDKVSLLYLESAPLELRQAIVEGLRPLQPEHSTERNWWEQRVPAMELLVSVLYHMKPRLRGDFLKEMLPKFGAINPVLLYRTAAHCACRHGDSRYFENAKYWLEECMWSEVQKAGYKRGVVALGKHRGPQHEVWDCKAEGGYHHVYVVRRGSYNPSQGQVVFFKPVPDQTPLFGREPLRGSPGIKGFPVDFIPTEGF